MPKQDIQHPDRAASTGAYFDGVILDGWLYTVGAFELITGQNAGTTTKAHTARITWNRSWSAATVTDLSAGFDRVHSPMVPEPNTVGPWISFGAVLDPLGPFRIVFTMPAGYIKAVAGTPGPPGRTRTTANQASMV